MLAQVYVCVCLQSRLFDEERVVVVVATTWFNTQCCFFLTRRVSSYI
jgi:hypothetical protein